MVTLDMSCAKKQLGRQGLFVNMKTLYFSVPKPFSRAISPLKL